MNPLPSSSRVTNLQNYNITKILGKKTYVPNLSASRMPKVKGEDNADTKKDDSSPAAERRKPFRERKLVQGSETFAPAMADSRITIKSRPKIASSTSSTTNSHTNSHSEAVKKEVDRDAPRGVPEMLPLKSYTGKFGRVSSAPAQDLPVSVPRPRLSIPSDEEKPQRLLMDLFDPSGDESPLFILKTPKYLPGAKDTKNPKAHSSKEEVKNEIQKCTIHDLPEGQIGTLQIMKSGRLRLVLGECKFWLHRGVRVNFKEELAFVNTVPESKTGEIVSLGSIKDRIIAVPESVTALTSDNPR